MDEPIQNTYVFNIGTTFIPIYYTKWTSDIYPYDSSYQPITNVTIVTGATAYDRSDISTYILLFHESIYSGKKLVHRLLNPNQLRHNKVDFFYNPYDNDRDMSIEMTEGVVISLRFEWTKLSFHTKVTTNNDFSECKRLDMTSDSPWESSEVSLAKT